MCKCSAKLLEYNLKEKCLRIRSKRLEERYICNSRVKRLQLQMRGLLRRLVAVRVEATDEINFKRREKEKR